MIYLYRCRECGRERDSTGRDDVRSCSCGGISRRVFCVNVANSFTPHYNHSVGAYVYSDRHFQSLLRQRSDENSLRTGTDHNYQPLDPRDLAESSKQLGVTDEGIEHTKRVRRNSGLDPSSATRVIAG